MKRCPRCALSLETSAFAPNGSRYDGLQAYCRECQRAKAHEHYLANKEQYIARAKRSKDRARANGKRGTQTYLAVRRQRLDELKSVPCADCGGSYSPWVMDFDHVRGEKAFNVGSGLSLGVARMLAEAAKCEVVCSNCHRERTQRRQRGRP